MATTTIGRQAETAVAKHLASRGYKISAQNWKTPRCEIDLIAAKDKCVYLIEVKYRSTGAQGTGFDYIGQHKLKRMYFAALVWGEESGWSGDIQLMAAAVSGLNFENIELVELR